MLQVWHLDVNVTVLDHAGNLTDACLLSAVAALMVFRRPEVEINTSNSGSGVARTLVLSPAVREPLPLSLHQLPLSTTFALFGVRSWAFQSASYMRRVHPCLCSVHMNASTSMSPRQFSQPRHHTAGLHQVCSFDIAFDIAMHTQRKGHCFLASCRGQPIALLPCRPVSPLSLIQPPGRKLLQAGW